MRIISRFVALTIWLATIPATQAAAQQQDAGKKKPSSPAAKPPSQTGHVSQRDPGLYMRFETTLGNITCKLYENEAPITVRKIVGLAIGKESYIDPRTKQKVSGKRFYDGLTFHRVIPNFMIQGGDPLGNGMGGPEGPGFPFQDEFVPTLKFDIPGRLAMANAGPRTNGSQFFITEVPTLSLNNRHTIFGQCSDLEVVRAIARVPTQEERPVKPVMIRRVAVERVGAAPANAPETLGGPRSAPKKSTGPVKKKPSTNR